MSYETLIQPVIERAEQKPDHLALVMVNEDGSEEQISARQFHDRAVAYAKTLWYAIFASPAHEFGSFLSVQETVFLLRRECCLSSDHIADHNRPFASGHKQAGQHRGY